MFHPIIVHDSNEFLSAIKSYRCSHKLSPIFPPSGVGQHSANEITFGPAFKYKSKSTGQKCFSIAPT